MRTFSIKLAIRKLLKQKSFTFINLGGLSISLAACIIIFVYASNEWSFDKHIPEYDRTYRIISGLGDGKYWARSFACYTDALSSRPEIESMTSYVQTENNIIWIGENEFIVSEAVIADTVFPDFFNIDFITGRKEDLGSPNKVFLTADLAEKLFPGRGAYGQKIFLNQFDGNTSDSLGLFTVAGIVKTLPENTHFGFQMIFSQKGNLKGFIDHLKNGKFFAANVYLRLFDKKQVPELETDLIDVLIPHLARSYGPPVEAFKSRLQPLREIHFTTDLNREPRPVIQKSLLYLLLSVGGLILVLLCMNFLSTAIVESLKQRKETGIMRILGANDFEIYTLSFAKIFFIAGTGLILSWFIIFLSGPWLDTIFVSNWDPWKLLNKILFFSIAAGLFVVITVSSGMHSFGVIRSVVDLLKGEMPSGRKFFGILGILTIIQFGIVVFLIGYSLMIGMQLRFLDNKDLGYTSENIYIARIPQEQPGGNILTEEIRKQPCVISASTAHHHPGDIFQHMDFTTGQLQYPFEFRMVDRDVFRTLDIDLIRKFSPENAEIKGWVINETFYKNLLQDFSEEYIAASRFDYVEDNEGDDSRTRFIIAGVMNDFHYSSLHDRIANFAFAIRNPESNYNRWLMVRFHEGQYKECITAVNEMMETYFPGSTHDGFLLSDNLASRYTSSRKLSEIIKIFTLLSILISGFGLYGLSLFIVQHRMKEIGIRKVFGASSRQVNSMLNLGFLKWVFISFCIACPVTLWAMKKWLLNFAYKASPSVWIFVLTGIIVTAIAVVSITFQIAGASRRNPADIIRYE